MCKNLKGKECGKGICQRKDGRYYVRYDSKTGGPLEKYFRSLPDARNWLEEVKYKDKHGTPVVSKDMTVDEWFRFWHDELLGGLSPNTKRNYREMTDLAYDILKAVHATKEFRRQSPSLSERLTYIDRRTGDERIFAMAAQDLAKAFGTHKHQDYHGPIRPCHRRVFGRRSQAVRAAQADDRAMKLCQNCVNSVSTSNDRTSEPLKNKDF